ncbi:hypothetical protein M8C21_021387 [Ambrosia artemisiifolia]|uniref:Uncharacterized protein n=1 Tax=Ambrosia artemisiifolia TaxID=4212 RepID=A0AAD5DDB0_AMBAR|nr:hypothetical protein M8C21_021387 [Ambrosia artemisiifolia]
MSPAGEQISTAAEIPASIILSREIDVRKSGFRYLKVDMDKEDCSLVTWYDDISLLGCFHIV